MKSILTILFLTCVVNAFSQFAIITDSDGFCNVRKEGEKNSKVIDKLLNGHLVYCFEDNGNWTNIDYTKKVKELNGYVYHDRYKLISGFSQMRMTTTTATKVILEKDSFQLTITQRKFNKKEHTFQYLKNYPEQIEKIDNKEYWGTDGGLPFNQFEKVEIKIGKKTVSLPKAALQGLYEPNLTSAEVYYDEKNDSFYIQTMNSDGAGGYLVVWKVEKGIYKERLVAHGF